MKHLGILPILLLLGVGITSGPAAADLTASQSVPPLAAVGETVQVTVMLAYNGNNATQVTVTPGLPPGVVTDLPGGQSAQLQAGAPAPISYPIRAVQSGTYTIISQISYADGGAWRELLLEAPFTAEGEIAPPPQEQLSTMPGGEMNAGGMDAGGMPGGERPQDGAGAPMGGMHPGGGPMGAFPGPANWQPGMPTGEVPPDDASAPNSNITAPA